jgi:hypothetical protein
MPGTGTRSETDHGDIKFMENVTINDLDAVEAVTDGDATIIKGGPLEIRELHIKVAVDK